MQAALKRSVALKKQARQQDRPRADPPRQHVANGAPLPGALPMTGRRLMPGPECENDTGGRFTTWPGGDSHGMPSVSADATASYASAAPVQGSLREGDRTDGQAIDWRASVAQPGRRWQTGQQPSAGDRSLHTAGAHGLIHVRPEPRPPDRIAASVEAVGGTEQPGDV